MQQVVINEIKSGIVDIKDNLTSHTESSLIQQDTLNYIQNGLLEKVSTISSLEVSLGNSKATNEKLEHNNSKLISENNILSCKCQELEKINQTLSLSSLSLEGKLEKIGSSVERLKHDLEKMSNDVYIVKEEIFKPQGITSND